MPWNAKERAAGRRLRRNESHRDFARRKGKTACFAISIAKDPPKGGVPPRSTYKTTVVVRGAACLVGRSRLPFRSFCHGRRSRLRRLRRRTQAARFSTHETILGVRLVVVPEQ